MNRKHDDDEIRIHDGSGKHITDFIAYIEMPLIDPHSHLCCQKIIGELTGKTIDLSRSSS